MRDQVLSVVQMQLLMDYMKTAADVVNLAKQCEACPDGPGYRVLNIHFENMCWKRDRDARVLAESLSNTFFAEQGPQVNPVEIASDTETSVF